MTRLTIVVALIVSVGATAQAQEKPDARFTAAADHVRKQFSPFKESVRVEGRHKTREDLVFHTRADWDATLKSYMETYRLGQKLPGGVVVKGYFVVPNKRTATFTLGVSGEKYMLVMTEAVDGAQFVLWGQSFANRKRYQSAKQRPFHRGYRTPRTVRYGL